MPGLTAFFHPRGTFEKQHAIETGPVRLEPSHELEERGHSPHNEGVKLPASGCQKILGLAHQNRQRKLEFLAHIGDGSGPLSHRFTQGNLKIRTENRQNNSRDTASRAYVEDHFIGLKDPSERERVDNIPAHELPVIRMPGEIHLRIPFVAKVEIAIKLADLLGKERNAVFREGLFESLRSCGGRLRGRLGGLHDIRLVARHRGLSSIEIVFFEIGSGVVFNHRVSL